MHDDEQSSLAELARRGAERADQQRAADKYEREHLREAVSAQKAQAAREHEIAFINQSRPWIKLARIAGWAGVAAAPMGWAMVLLFRRDAPRISISSGQWVAAWSFAIGGMLALPLLFLRRRLVAGAIERERARIARYHVEGWFEALGGSWDSSGRFGRGHAFGKISFFVALTSEAPPLPVLENAVAAVVRDAEVTSSPGGITITSPMFRFGFDAYAWSRAIVDRLLPSIARDAGLRHVRVNRDRNG